MAGRRAGRAGHVVIAYLWVPYFGVHVARRAEPRLAEQSLVLLDEHGRVLAADVHAAQAGVRPDLSERQAAAHCPDASAAARRALPHLPRRREQFLSRIKGYTDRWQPDGLGRVYLDATTCLATGPPGPRSSKSS